MKLVRSIYCCGANPTRPTHEYRPTEQAAAELTEAERATAATSEQAAAERAAAAASERAAAESTSAAAAASEQAAAEAAEQAAAEAAKREKAHGFRRRTVFDCPVYLLNILQHCSAEEAGPFLHNKSVEYKEVLFNAAGDDIRLKAIILSHVPVDNQKELFSNLNSGQQIELFSNLNNGQQIKLLQNLINTNPKFKDENGELYNQLIAGIHLGEGRDACLKRKAIKLLLTWDFTRFTDDCVKIMCLQLKIINTNRYEERQDVPVFGESETITVPKPLLDSINARKFDRDAKRDSGAFESVFYGEGETGTRTLRPMTVKIYQTWGSHIMLPESASDLT